MKLSNFEYLGVLLACYSFPLVFSIIHRRILRKEGVGLVNRTVWLAGLPFLVWDMWAVNTGRWSFNEEVITGIKIWNLPIEEVLFFALIPQSCLLLWAGMKKYKTFREVKADIQKHEWMKPFLKEKRK